jgi:hypothetical protein
MAGALSVPPGTVDRDHHVICACRDEHVFEVLSQAEQPDPEELVRTLGREACKVYVFYQGGVVQDTIDVAEEHASVRHFNVRSLFQSGEIPRSARSAKKKLVHAFSRYLGREQIARRPFPRYLEREPVACRRPFLVCATRSPLVYHGENMLPLWFPDPQHVDHIDRAGAVTIERLCELTQTPCRASGAWMQRPVVLQVIEAGQEPWLRAEREADGAVQIGVPPLADDAVEQARWALGCLAYSPLRDAVALASCRRQDWAPVSPDLPIARHQLSAQARDFVDELAQVYLRHRLAIGASDPKADLVVEPLTEDALEAIRHALPRGSAR